MKDLHSFLCESVEKKAKFKIATNVLPELLLKNLKLKNLIKENLSVKLFYSNLVCKKEMYKSSSNPCWSQFVFKDTTFCVNLAHHDLTDRHVKFGSNLLRHPV